MTGRNFQVSNSGNGNDVRIRDGTFYNQNWKKKKIQKSRIVFRILKTCLFIVCSAFFFYQSANFFFQYRTYPTATKFTVTYPEKIKLPAITFCYDNLIKRSKFCGKFKNLCERPNNLDEFCKNYPYSCTEDSKNVKIPKMNSISTGILSTPVKEQLKQVYETRRPSLRNEWRDWSWKAPDRKMTATLVINPNEYGYFTCYTTNLLLSNQRPVDIWQIDKEFPQRNFHVFIFKLEENETFIPWKKAQVFFTVHSPHIPVNPIFRGDPLKIGHEYRVLVRLEKELLKPYPYQTDCTDYNELWERNNRTGPRSKEMCKDWCQWPASCTELNAFVSMIPFSDLECPNKKFFDESKGNITKDECMKSCKEDCEKLKYSYKVVEKEIGQEKEKREGKIYVRFHLADTAVVEMSHIPAYDMGDFFSHIGGLMGCWLGISAWTFAGILEKLFGKVIHLIQKLGRCGRRIHSCQTAQPH